MSGTAPARLRKLLLCTIIVTVVGEIEAMLHLKVEGRRVVRWWTGIVDGMKTRWRWHSYTLANDW